MATAARQLWNGLLVLWRTSYLVALAQSIFSRAGPSWSFPLFSCKTWRGVCVKVSLFLNPIRRTECNVNMFFLEISTLCFPYVLPGWRAVQLHLRVGSTPIRSATTQTSHVHFALYKYLVSFLVVARDVNYLFSKLYFLSAGKQACWVFPCEWLNT